MFGSSAGLIIAALIGIAVIVCLIVFAKVHAFLALMLGSFVMAILAGVPLTDSFTSFTTGLGSTVGNVGVLITLGSMIGVLLTKTGASDQIVDTIVAHSSKKALPWAIAAVAFIMGISLFFEVGLVLMIPVVMSLAKRQNMPAIALGIPAIAALGCLHGFVPPHPGPLTAPTSMLTWASHLLSACSLPFPPRSSPVRWLLSGWPRLCPSRQTRPMLRATLQSLSRTVPPSSLRS